MTKLHEGPTESHAPIGFLSYSGRSGSTLLARQISDSDSGVVMVPEFRTLQVLLTSDRLESQDLVPELLTGIVADDGQLAQYTDLSTEAIADFVAAEAAQHGWQGAVRSLAAIATGLDYESTVRSSPIVFKMGYAVFSWSQVTNRLPSAHLFFLHRHPCAVVNSQLNTTRAYFEGENMGRSDPWHCAVFWRRGVQAARRIESEHDRDSIFMLSYSDVLSGSAADQVVGALGAASQPDTTVAGPRFRVAPAEESLHPLIDNAPDPSRSDAWETELSNDAQSIISWLTQDEAKSLGYELPDPATRLEVAIGLVRHQFAFARYATTRLRSYWARPGMIVQHLRVRSRTLRNR